MPGFVGSFSYSERNLFGLNQKLSALVELGQVCMGQHWQGSTAKLNAHRPTHWLPQLLLIPVLSLIHVYSSPPHFHSHRWTRSSACSTPTPGFWVTRTAPHARCSS